MRCAVDASTRRTDRSRSASPIRVAGSEVVLVHPGQPESDPGADDAPDSRHDDADGLNAELGGIALQQACDARRRIGGDAERGGGEDARQQRSQHAADAMDAEALADGMTEQLIDVLGRHPALQVQAARGVEQQLVGVTFDGPPVWGVRDSWSVTDAEGRIGEVTSAVWSPRLETNVAMGMMRADRARIGVSVQIEAGDGVRSGTVCAMPFPGSSQR